MQLQNIHNRYASVSASPRVVNDQPATEPPDQSMVDKIIDNTYLGANYTASALSGAITGVGSFVYSAPIFTARSLGAVIPNLWKAETLGPNIKILGTVAAAPLLLAGAVVGLPVSLVSGIWNGVSEVDPSTPRQFTIGSAAQAGFVDTNNGWRGLTDGLVEDWKSLGEAKLSPGQKPLDIPIIKTVKTLLVGAAGAAVGGVTGVAAAALSGLREAGVGIVESVTDKNLGLLGKAHAAVGSVVGGVVHGATFGVGTAFGSLFVGLGETWRQDSLFGGLGSVLKHAKNTVFTAVAPETAAFNEVEPDPRP